MRLVIIDANVYVNFFKKFIQRVEHTTEDCPFKLCKRLQDEEAILIFDSGGQIVHEYNSNTKGNEFTEVWKTNLLRDGLAYEISPDTFRQDLQRLRALNFPLNNSRDKWHVRTALTAAKTFETEIFIISEDLDFYSPAEKANCNPARRSSILQNPQGKVHKYLKSTNVKVHSIISYIQ